MKTIFATTVVLATITLATEITSQVDASAEQRIFARRRDEINDLIWGVNTERCSITCETQECPDLNDQEVLEALDAIMENGAFGFGFWCKDGDGSIDRCEFDFFWRCFREVLGCEFESDTADEVLSDFDNGDCALKRYEWIRLIRSSNCDD